MKTAAAPLVAALLACLLLPGCTLLEVRRQQEQGRRMCRLSGKVSALEPADGPLVVVLVRHPETGDEEAAIVDHYVLERDGRFYFGVSCPNPSTYSIGAFHDRNRDLTYDPDEPARAPDMETTFELTTGQTRDGIDIVIHPDERAPVEGPLDIRALVTRSTREQQAVTLGQLSVVGDVADLAEARFGPESGPLGLWRPADFVLDLGPGLYFLEEFDERRIPVLFVHGMSGYPQEFSYLIDRLDRERFQPWFYFYPSGGHLPRVIEHLSQLVAQLHARHRFRRLFVVAHSMGGLVARGVLLHHEEITGDACARLFVSLSTPWGGHTAAQKGAERSPVVVHSWIDMAPDSEFLRGLFFWDPETGLHPRELPDHTSYHLLFSFKRNAVLPGASSDTVVTLKSQLHPEAQREADSVFGFNADHTGILRRPETAALLNEILENAADSL
jgi:pimeloyl-ACP methyl ester carboxylesterase